MPKQWSARRWYLVGVIGLMSLIGLGLFLLSAPAPSIVLESTPIASSAPPESSAPAPTATPARKVVDPLARPYSDDSPWNIPIGANLRYDIHSDDMIATIKRKNEGAITSDATQYSYPVYFVDRATPRWDVPCLKHKCTIVRADGVEKTDMLKDVPIPADARQSTGTDGQIIIIDRQSGAEYNLWQVQRTAEGWTASNASIYNVFWNAAPENYGSRGAGVPYFAGLVRPWEIKQGRIDHAIAFGYPTPARDRCVYPASKTDGNSGLPYAIPEGARLQLDPRLTEADFDRMGLDRTGKIIARALQKYGMFLIDISGRSKIYVENLDDNPFKTQDWTDPELNLTSTTIAKIPVDSFHVLALPKAYWDKDATANATMHGECFAS
jgi:hypothetical protein